MLSLHDIHVFDKIKTKFQELDCEWTGQMEEYTKTPPKLVIFQFNKITFRSLRLQDLGFNFSKLSCPQSPLASSTDECDFFFNKKLGY
jgi:hypothetical protein